MLMREGGAMRAHSQEERKDDGAHRSSSRREARLCESEKVFMRFLYLFIIILHTIRTPLLVVTYSEYP